MNNSATGSSRKRCRYEGRSPRLQDILDSIAAIQRHTPKIRAEFDADEPIRSHILLYIQIIGEAASKLSASLRDGHTHIPWKSIMGMRNIITHVYFGIDWDEVWQVVAADLTPLKGQIQAVLATLPPAP